MMLLQQFLRSGLTLTDLGQKYAIKARRHAAHPSLVHFLYNEYDSPMGEPIVQECRGVILDEANDWSVVARPFDKFFNSHEGHAAPLDWSTARVQEKVDGSLAFLYFYAGKWHVSTKGVPDASGRLGKREETFASLFWRTFAELGLSLPSEEHADLTFIFELFTPENQNVVRVDKSRIVLLAVRARNTGTYLPIDVHGSALGPVELVREFPLRTLEEIQAAFAGVSPFQSEGYVAVDDGFRRVKVKSPQYVAMHHARDTANPKWFLDVVRRGETPEVVSHFPDLAPEFNVVKAKYDALVTMLDEGYEKVRGIEVQKDFALVVVKTAWPGVFFQRRKYGLSTRDVLVDWQLDKLAESMGISFHDAGETL